MKESDRNTWVNLFCQDTACACRKGGDEKLPPKNGSLRDQPTDFLFCVKICDGGRRGTMQKHATFLILLYLYCLVLKEHLQSNYTITGWKHKFSLAAK